MKYCDLPMECKYEMKCTNHYDNGLIKQLYSFINQENIWFGNTLDGFLYVEIRFDGIKNFEEIRTNIYDLIKSKGYELRYESMDYNNLILKAKYKRICYLLK